MMYFTVWMLFALVTCVAASSRGRSPFGWFIIGFFLSFFGLILVLVMKPIENEQPQTARLSSPETSPTRACPYCAEDIKYAAIKCKHCGADVEAAEPPQAALLASGWTVRVSCATDEERDAAVALFQRLDLPVLDGEDFVAIAGPFEAKEEASRVKKSLGIKHYLHGDLYWQPSTAASA